MLSCVQIGLGIKSMALCVHKEQFYEKLEELKQSKEGDSKFTVFIDDDLYKNAKTWLQNSKKNHEEFGLSKLEVKAIERKQWTLQNDNILSKDMKIVVPRQDLHKILTDVHSQTAHRGRDKTEDYLKKTYAEISQHVIQPFVGLCHLHKQQASVTHPTKRPITNPIQANRYLCHVQLDLMDFRNLECSCGKKHKWILHITDHYSKFSWLCALVQKTAEEVLQSVEKLFWLFGFPTVLHTDNGGEFKNKEIRAFCESHNIKLVHGVPRTPQIQGLVERNNRTVKENLSNIIKEKQADKTKWCNFVEEAAYKKNITVHRAKSKSPYEVVFGILPQHQTINQTATTATDSNFNSFRYSNSSSRTHKSGRCHRRR